MFFVQIQKLIDLCLQHKKKIDKSGNCFLKKEKLVKIKFFKTDFIAFRWRFGKENKLSLL